ncbi:MAG: hypothetical protein ACQEVA_05105 [Myxococcota bacterium]
MAEDKDKNSPSADEIVDELAADMGVEDDEVPEEEDSSVGDLGGIFDVPSSRKRKKKKKKSKKEKLKAALEKEKEKEGATAGDEPSDADETVEKEVAADSESAGGAPEKKKKKKSSDDGTVGGVFNPKAKEDDVDLMAGGVDDAYLDDDDLGDYGGGGASTSSIVMGGVIALLLAVIGVLVFQFTDVGKRMYWLMTGQLESRELKEAEAEAERKRKEHLEGLTKYGSLNITGSPQYSLLKLDGEVQYGQTSTGEWKELRLTPQTVFKGLKAGEKHEIVVDAPGHKRKSYDLTEGMWEGKPEQPTSYRKTLNVTLIPESGEKQIEFQQRLESDVENDYFGTLEINTIPSGAYVILDNRLMRNKDGSPMTTPVSTDKYWAAEKLVGSDEEDKAEEKEPAKGQKAGQQSGEQPAREDLVPKMLAREQSDMTLEEKEIRVDTPRDRGHKLQVRVPDDKGDYPHYITNVERQMWECHWKDGEAPDKQPYTEACDYEYTLELDFNSLKSYIERREEEKKKIMEKNAQLKAEAGKDGEGEGDEEAKTQ